MSEKEETERENGGIIVRQRKYEPADLFVMRVWFEAMPHMTPVERRAAANWIMSISESRDGARVTYDASE